MQIVRTLAGYDYGRADLVRRAMSKKKASVMEKNASFSYMAVMAFPDASKTAFLSRQQTAFLTR